MEHEPHYLVARDDGEHYAPCPVCGEEVHVPTKEVPAERGGHTTEYGFSLFSQHVQGHNA